MGTSCRKSDINKLSKDHPHAYGDKRLFPRRFLHSVGSSPRVWGQEFPMTEYEDEDRIIPTRMGTSRLQRIFTVFCRDHPHAYGDKPPFPLRVICWKGSSPRVWGQGPPKPPKKQRHRIIPTRMGTSRACNDLWYPYRDHPHAYGDKCWLS